MTNSLPYFTFVGGLIIGAAVGALWYAGGAGAPSGTQATDTAAQMASTTTATPTAAAGVSVTDQPAGMAVTVSSVNLPLTSAWVAVRETAGSVNGSVNLLNTLGAAKVTLPATNISVPLLRATVPGARYAVEIYRDDGSGAFDPAQNSVYVETGSGEPAVSYFSTTQ